jgi:pimeloyl-ACP methyl ester carboxylesterase
MASSRKLRRFVAILGLGLGIAALAPSPAPAHFRSSDCQAYGSTFLQRCAVRFSWIKGFNDPSTPDNLDRVGVLKVGSPLARNVLVLNPGTSAGSGYFRPLADDIVRDTHGRWQVWSVERRENQLEDHSVLDAYKQGKATPQRLFDYYLGFLANSSVSDHFQLIPDSSVAYGRGWGMNVEINDLHRVVDAAGRFGRRVVLGGHSLGGSITTAYATWDFNGKPGAKGLSGLVYIDGGSNPVPVTPQAATQSLQGLQSSSPWLSFGGIPAPFAGLFSATGSCGTVYDPNRPSLGYTFPLLPANLKPPLPAGVVPTNEAQYGFAVDNDTSPPSLAAAQGHIGHLATSGNPRGWVDDEISPIGRFAAMFCGKGIRSIDGTAWYHPLRLTIDSGAVADGNANPAQSVLDVHATHGHDLGRKMKIYAFGAALGGQGVLATASVLAQQSGIPSGNLTLVNRQSTYSHNDPSSAAPRNDFVANLIPFLGKIGKPRLHRR